MSIFTKDNFIKNVAENSLLQRGDECLLDNFTELFYNINVSNNQAKIG